MNNDKRSERWWLLLTTSLLWVLFFHIAAATQGTYDTLRDAWFAASISSDHAFPAIGPGIFQTFHLGPLWFYVVAVPALLFDPLQAVVLSCTLLVALQFQLAWCLARNIAGRTAALVFVMLLFAPGWWYLSLPVLTHTAGVAASLMFLGLMLWSALQRPDIPRGLMLGTAVALALSAHPTNVLLCAVATLAFLTEARKQGRLRLFWAIVAPVFLVMAPYLLFGGFANDLVAITGYAESLTGADTARDPVELLQLLAQPIYAGSAFAWVVWGGLPPVVARVAGGLPVALALLCLLVGGRKTIPSGTRRWALWAMSCLGMQVLLLWIVRDVTPFWMAFALAPLLAFALSVSAGQAMDAWTSRRLRMLALFSLSLVTLLPSVLLLSRMLPNDGYADWAIYPNDSKGAMSVTSPVVGHQRIRVPSLSLRDYWRDPALKPRCGEKQVLHGELAAVADRSLGYAWIAGCADAGIVSLGAVHADDDRRHRFAVSARMHRSVCGGLEASETALHELDASDFRVLSPGRGLPFADPYVYPPRSIPATAAGLTFEVSVDASRWSHVLLANLAHGYYPFPAFETAGVAGQSMAMQPVDELAGVRLYALEERSVDGGPARFRIGFSPDYIDVVAFRCRR